MVAYFKLSDTPEKVAVDFYFHNEFVSGLEYRDHMDDPHTCTVVETAYPFFNLQIIAKNKYEAAFDNLANTLPIIFPPGCGEKLVFDFKFERYNGPIRFPNRLTNIDEIIFQGNATPHLINEWNNGISHYYVPNITIHVNPEEIMVGLGQLGAVRNAKRLQIVGAGTSDITDFEMVNFACEEINIKSINLTAVGIRYMLGKCYEHHHGDDTWVATIRARINNPQEFFDRFVPDGDRNAWNVEYIEQNLDAFPHEQHIDI